MVDSKLHDDNLNAVEIQQRLICQCLSRQILVEQIVTSTSDIIKDAAKDGLAEGMLVVSESQSSGRGRGGKSFYSPPGAGIYMSFWAPYLPTNNPGMLTLAAAVAVCEAIEQLTDLKPQIKWVNDIWLGQLKVCGILAEILSTPSAVTGAVVGIGINIDKHPLPPELDSIVGALSQRELRQFSRNQMISQVLNAFENWYMNKATADLLEAYRRRSLVLGSDLSFISEGRLEQGRGLCIDEAGHLHVLLSDGQVRILHSGEISVRPVMM